MQHQLFYELLLLLLLLLIKNVIESKAGYRSRQELGSYAIPPAVAATDADLFSFCTLKMQLIRSTAFLTSDAAASEASAADFCSCYKRTTSFRQQEVNKSATLFNDEVQSNNSVAANQSSFPLLWSHQPYKTNPQGFHHSEEKR